MEKNSKRTFITNSQKATMIEYLKTNPDLVSGKFSNTFTFKDATKKWSDLSNILNSMPGCSKDWKSWRKTWQDMRSRTKTKKSKNRNYLGGTGGGPFYEDPLTKYEEDILGIIKVVSVEGHNSTKETIVNFDFNNERVKNNEMDHTEDNITNINNGESNDVYMNEIDTTDKIELEILGEEESRKVINTPVNSVVNTPKKIPKRHTKLKNATAAAEMFQKTYKQKVSSKENYMGRKIELVERIAVAKERSANTREKIVALQERCANAGERIANSLENVVELIKEFI